jgi:hypothetical protein
MIPAAYAHFLAIGKTPLPHPTSIPTSQGLMLWAQRMTQVIGFAAAGPLDSTWKTGSRWRREHRAGSPS